MDIIRQEQDMKPANFQWLEEIPKTWDIRRGKTILRLLKRSVLEDDGVVTCFRDGEVTLRSNRREDGFTNSLKEIGYQGVEPGDLVVHGMDGFAGAIGISDSRGKMSPIINVMDSTENKRFLVFYLRAMANADVFLSLSTGIRERSCDLRWNKIASFPFIIPPLDEQQAIASYLDDRCSKIDAIIAEAKANIEEYKELKQAVITQAVTLGIKKNRPLKDTNILWIGKTPCDWQVAELKFFASIKSGITLGQKYPAGAKLVEMPYLRVANVQGEYVDLSDVKTIQVLPEEVDKYRLEAGVVLMTEGGDRDKLGRGCVWHGEIAPCLHQNHVFAVTTKSDKLLPEYFSHVTTSEVARCYFDYTAKKTTNLANTNSSTIMNFRLPIPPLEEQREIVQYLDKRIKTLNAMISEKQSLIADLEAYKKSLIYEVVTGKRKVVA